MFRALPLTLAIVSCVSCSAVFENARNSADRRPAANGVLVGTSNLAMCLTRSTLLSGLHHPLKTTKLGAVVLWNRPREFLHATFPTGSPVPSGSYPSPGSPGFEALLDERGLPRPISGKPTWLVDGRGFFGEFDRQIAAARKSIDVQVFIFDNDDIAVRYADRLKSRSHGIPVRVLFDDLGNTFAKISPPETAAPAGFVPPPDMAGYLKKNSAIQVRRNSNPWLVCDHTKLLVFDRQTAILGGMNIGREYFSEWHDLMVKIEGPAAESLALEFDGAWRHSRLLGDLQPPGPRGAGGIGSIPNAVPLRILRTDPAEGRYEILEASLMAIRSARKRVWAETPYLANKDLKVALAAAARRGVDVRVVIPVRADSSILDSANLAAAKHLLQAGAKVFRYPRMTHMKVMLCDGWSTVGSANLDTLSMRINRELNLAFPDGKATDALVRQVFEPDFRHSKPLRLSDTGSPVAPAVEVIANQL